MARDRRQIARLRRYAATLFQQYIDGISDLFLSVRGSREKAQSGGELAPLAKERGLAAKQTPLLGASDTFPDIANLDEFKRPRWLPDLPDSALPQGVGRKGARNSGGSGKSENGHNGSGPLSTSDRHNGHGSASAAENGRNEALRDIQTLSKRVGRNLFRSILVGIAGVDNPAQVEDVVAFEAARLRDSTSGGEARDLKR